MTHLVQRREVHCPFVRALVYFDEYLVHLGWSERSQAVELHVRVPLDTLGIGGDLALDTDVMATLERSPQNQGLAKAIAVTWRPKGRAPFPCFDGSLSLEAATPKACALILEGDYEPPLGVAGKLFDAALGHRIAEATAGQLLKDITDRMERAYVKDEPHLSR